MVLVVASSILVCQPNRRIVQLGRTLALGARGHTFKSCYADQTKKKCNVGIMKKATRIRTLVKTIIYRCWVIISTYVMLLITGQNYDTAILPAIIINIIWTTSYYLYDRLWLRINWGLTEE